MIVAQFHVALLQPRVAFALVAGPGGVDLLIVAVPQRAAQQKLQLVAQTVDPVRLSIFRSIDIRNR